MEAAGVVCTARNSILVRYQIPTTTRVDTSGDRAINLELLTTAILNHWKHLEIDPTAFILNELNKSQAQNERGFTYLY